MTKKEYAMKCKHYSGYTGQCYKKSLSGNGWFIDFLCDCKCQRMKNYEKRNKANKAKRKNDGDK